MTVDPDVERFAIDLAAHVRDAVAPSLGEPGARVGVGVAPGGDVTMAIDEIHRVLASGGQALSLDFNRPSNGIVRSAYLAYLTVVGGALGWMLHRDPDTYRYIPASIRQYPGAAAVAALFEARGFCSVRCYRVLGGLMTIHHATRN